MFSLKGQIVNILSVGGHMCVPARVHARARVCVRTHTHVSVFYNPLKMVKLSLVFKPFKRLTSELAYDLQFLAPAAECSVV